jgi:polysaccharide pyruvyl transferase WcaK-like protein
MLAETIINAFNQIKNSSEIGIFDLSIFSACADPHDGDVEISNYLFIELQRLGLNVRLVEYDGNNTETFAKNIQRCTAVITSRMHVGVISAIGGVPLLQIAYASKVNNFYDHSGIGAEYILDPVNFSSATIIDFIGLAINGRLEKYSLTRKEILSSKRDSVASTMVLLAEMAES